MWNTLDSFYKSPTWTRFRKTIIADRIPICWHCKEAFKATDTIVVHHKEDLTLANVNDYNVSLNPANVEMVHLTCHNKIHDKRYGYNHYKKKIKSRTVYIVYGPPMAGKTSYVLDNKNDDDIVIDMDRLFEAVTLLERYNKPNCLLPNVLSIRDKLIENIRLRYGRFNNAWIIGGYADKYQRDSLQRELGAELILINPGKETILKRFNECNDFRSKKKEEWENYINDWYDKFIP
ncbi:MAG: HNH endonuclease signature motif containing protein [Sarcina sp.]